MVTVHHLYWPRRDYQTQVERRFRSLPWNKIDMPADAHELIHRYAPPPAKPPLEEMLSAVEMWELMERQRRAQRLLMLRGGRSRKRRSA